MDVWRLAVCNSEYVHVQCTKNCRMWSAMSSTCGGGRGVAPDDVFCVFLAARARSGQ